MFSIQRLSAFLCFILSCAEELLDGLIKRDSDIRLVRDGVQVYKGRIGSLKRFKDDASEVRNGMECGINIANFNDVKKGDVIEAFVTERIAAEMGVA